MLPFIRSKFNFYIPNACLSLRSFNILFIPFPAPFFSFCYYGIENYYEKRVPISANTFFINCEQYNTTEIFPGDVLNFNM